MGNIRVTNECNWVGFHLANSTTQEASLAGKFTGGVVETLDHVGKSQLLCRRM